MSFTGNPLNLEKIDYRQSGWNAIHNANAIKINNFAATVEASANLSFGKLTEKTATVVQIEAILTGTYDYVMVSGYRVDLATAIECDLSTVETIDATGAETGSTPAASTLYYAYLSNSEAVISEELRLSTTAPTDGYLVANWRYMGKVVTDAAIEVERISDAGGVHLRTLLELLTSTDRLSYEFVRGVASAQRICCGRLSLETGVAVSTTDQTAKTTVYLVPYKGNKISLYGGTIWEEFSFTEKSIAVPATTVTPFDVFAYNNSGVVALEALSWTNDTTRATALAYQDGVEVKSGDATRLYLGTSRTTSVSGQTEDSVTKRFLWSRYNQTPKKLYRVETTNHTYDTGTWRAWNNDAAQIVEVVTGQAGVHSAGLLAGGYNGNYCGIGLNSVTPSGQSVIVNNYTAEVRFDITEIFSLAAGYNYFSICEYGNATPAMFVAAVLSSLWEC